MRMKGTVMMRTREGSGGVDGSSFSSPHFLVFFLLLLLLLIFFLAPRLLDATIYSPGASRRAALAAWRRCQLADVFL